MVDAQFHPLMVAAVQPETDQAMRISFLVPGELRPSFRYRQGQYLTLQVGIEGKMVRRSYSICSSVRDDKLQVAVKRVQGGVFSNFANESLAVGSVVDVLAPQGGFHTSLDPAASKNYLFIASGSGITPVISNIKTILEEEPHSEVTLLLGNQRSSTIMFREALCFLKNRYMTRFHWVNIMSREDQGADILNGRLNNRKGAELNRRLIDLGSYDEHFICGPESMISEVSRGLRAFGIDDSHIHYELFSASAEKARAVMDRHQARARAYGGKRCQVTVVMDGRASRFELASDGENLLDAGLNHGIDLPYSCKDGVCSTCKARLLEGEVDMDASHGLENAERAAGYILTCQAHPLSDTVVVDYDQK